MLTKIKKIQGLGVFGSFVAATDLPDFARFNVIYGENGSGKTTLSRLFRALESGEHPEHPDLEFNVATQSGLLTHGQKYARRVRVFNSDYVEASIGQFQSPLQHILIVGEANKALADEVKAEKNILAERNEKIETANKTVGKAENDKGKLFSSIAKTIGEATSGATLRNYRKPDAEEAFAANRDPRPLGAEPLETCRATVRQEQLELIPHIAPTLLNLDEARGQQSAIDAASQIPELVKQLLQKTAQSEALSKLSFKEPSIASWVEEGLALHQKFGSDQCEFCQQPMPGLRFKQIAEHFGAEDQRLKHEILSAQQLIREVVDAISIQAWPTKSSFYAELRDDFEKSHAALRIAQDKLLADLEACVATLDRKLQERASSYEEPVSVDTVHFLDAITLLTKLVERHNAKTEGFTQAKSTAGNAIEEHYLSTVADQIKEFETFIASQKDLIAKLTDGTADPIDTRSIQALNESIEGKQARVSDAHAGGAELTARLRAFLGRTDLKFESNAEGYHVLRRGKSAKRLSEGEKTAIAFLYFILQLQDQNFDVAEGVIVIDDPISSLDASSMYQAFAFLKNAVKDAKQIFILTHNFDFLKLLLDWLRHLKKKAQAYMIVCTESENSREARLIPLDALLFNHPTEYHYFFKLLHQFRSDGTIQASYHIPNVARKVLETFLEYHDPSSKSLYDKLESMDFDQNKKTAIYKFSNDLSHRTGKGFDPALVAETQKNVIYLLEMIKALAPNHYSGLEEASLAN